MCRSSCPTQDHASWGECARSANLRIGYCGIGGGDATKEKQLQRELSEYRAAKAQGIQPRSTYTKDIRQAVEISNRTGVAFDSSAL